LCLTGRYLIRLIRLFPRFFRSLSIFEKNLVGVVGVRIGFGFVGVFIGMQLPDFIDAAVVVSVLILVFTISRRILSAVLWRLRNRLIATYIFIGIVPIVLIVSMLGIAMYMLAGQGVAYLITTELERRNDVTRNSALTIASSLAFRSPTETPEDVGRRVLDDFGARFPTLNLIARVDGRDVSIGPNPTGLEFSTSMEAGFRGVIRVDRDLVVAARVTSGPPGNEVHVLAYESVDDRLLSDLLPGLATTTLFSDLVLGAADSRPAGLQIQVEDQRVRAENAPESMGWWDVPVVWTAGIPVHDLDGTPEGQEQTLVVSRPSQIVRQLFSPLSDGGSTLGAVLVAIAVLFLGVELFSLLLGLGLTRSITHSVADLYGATLKVQAGDFSERIPIRTQDQLSELATSFNNMTENIQGLIDESKEKERLKSELEIARDVQRRLFPKDVPQMRSLELAGICNPARVVSGDYYDFLSLDSRWMALAISDISGKGISAALLMASIQAALRAQLTSLYDGARSDDAERAPVSTSLLVTHLNRQLYENTSTEKYATLCCALYDDESGRLVYTNAGHLPPILIHNGASTRLEVSGMVVGIFPESEYEENDVRMESGDLLVAFTDGVTEAENERGQEFGDDRLLDLLLSNADRPLDQVISVVNTAVQAWTHDFEMRDDMTMLLARRV
jgi:sigma-B regulation protein RsbU (phosphoserine phosphatase)